MTPDQSRGAVELDLRSAEEALSGRAVRRVPLRDIERTTLAAFLPQARLRVLRFDGPIPKVVDGGGMPARALGAVEPLG